MRRLSLPLLLVSLVASLLVSLLASRPSIAQDIPVPEGNRASLRQAPPRPGHGDLDERARALFAAILADQPESATAMFMPREVFRAIKGISDPDGLYDRIVRMYANDIHALHASVPADAEFVRFEFSGHRGWVSIREESNRLPYWAQRHSYIVYTSGGREQRFEVRTMIAWDERWYITHLSEFRH